MKKRIIFSAFILLNVSVFAQKSEKQNEFNKWTIELTTGEAKGIKPFNTGYYSSDPSSTFGDFKINSYEFGTRYMFNPRFGLKLNFGYDDLQNYKSSSSLPFQVLQYKTGIQGYVNAMRMLKLEEASNRWGLLLHGGFQYLLTKNKTISPLHTVDVTENNFGFIFGLTPQYRITNNIALISDFSIVNTFRQHLNWDGSKADLSENLNGQLTSVTFGLSVSLGKNKKHGDFGIVATKSDLELAAVTERVSELETMLNDTDKDGVPDYLDVENNSTAGVAVDSKGRMIDLNNNGVPDELEKFVDNSVNIASKKSMEASEGAMVAKLINDKYISVYFDTNKTKPTVTSYENIGIVLQYLLNNPSATVDVYGNADEIGSTAYNNKLASARAENIKTTLVKSGVSSSRINIISNGEDTSVDKNSAEARRFVRRVYFKIKN